MKYRMDDYKRQFVSQEFIDNYEKYFNMDIEKKSELGVKIVKNAIIHPFQVYDFENTWTKPAYGGVTDENLNYIEESALINILTEHNNQVSERIKGFNPNYNFNNIRYVDEPVVFLGRLDDAWGHFIQESIVRLWYFLDNPDCKYKVAYLTRDKDVFLDYINLFGISRERLIRIDSPTKFKEVIIPEPSYRLSDYYHAKFKMITDKMTENVPAGKYKKIYLAHSAHPVQTRLLGEKEIEQVFRDNGYKVVAPENLTAEEKISLMKGADVIVNVFGSGGLNILFSKEGTKLILLNRSSFFYPETPFMEKVTKADIYHVDAYKELLPVHGGVGPFLVTLTPYLEKLFNELGLKYNKAEFLNQLQVNTFIFYKSWAVYYSDLACANLLQRMCPDIDIQGVRRNIANVVNNVDFLVHNK